MIRSSINEKKIKPFKLKKFKKEEFPYFTKLSKISLYPPKKLCDITGLPAPYTDARSLIKYYDLGVYEYLNNIEYSEIEAYYEINNYERKI